MYAALLLNAFGTFCMTGLIFLIQLVHYPSFAYVDKENFRLFCDFHQQSTTYVVLPLMTLELLTACALPWLIHPSLRTWCWLGLIFVVLIWLSTFFIQVPLHSELLKGFNQDTIEKLCWTNWIRTLLWTGRSLLLIGLLFQSQKLL